MIPDIQRFLPLVDRSTVITTNHREDYFFGHSLPTAIPGKLLRQPQNLVVVELILSTPILFTARIHFRLFFSTTKATPRYDYFCDGTYKFSQEFTKDMSEDQVNVTKEYRKPRTKVRKMLTFLTSDPPIKV
ncbi:uncharacterized protein LOC112890668 [Panicum hallii]|uniref:uncharacterized protein LOC112890668 n=1 Tax=Panicum hallii TaxID=206008 RepID=UPI000DF4DDAE|nr:uncharacterized protein LOC112890668 [Panicum hallii]